MINMIWGKLICILLPILVFWFDQFHSRYMYIWLIVKSLLLAINSLCGGILCLFCFIDVVNQPACHFCSSNRAPGGRKNSLTDFRWELILTKSLKKRGQNSLYTNSMENVVKMTAKVSNPCCMMNEFSILVLLACLHIEFS